MSVPVYWVNRAQRYGQIRLKTPSSAWNPSASLEAAGRRMPERRGGRRCVRARSRFHDFVQECEHAQRSKHLTYGRTAQGWLEQCVRPPSGKPGFLRVFIVCGPGVPKVTRVSI